VGVAAGAALLTQRFDTRGQADDRTSAAGHFSAGLGATVALAGAVYASADASGQTYLYSKADRDGGDPSLGTSFALRLALALGAHW
jgi:hypothetical protein